MKKKNRGSAVIEITLLMPILLGCIYFYIMLFVFLLNSGKGMEKMAENMYMAENIEKTAWEENVFVRTEGEVKIFRIEDIGKLFDMHIELRKQEENEVENIRRWQLVTDSF